MQYDITIRDLMGGGLKCQKCHILKKNILLKNKSEKNEMHGYNVHKTLNLNCGANTAIY